MTTYSPSNHSAHRSARVARYLLLGTTLVVSLFVFLGQSARADQEGGGDARSDASETDAQQRAAAALQAEEVEEAPNAGEPADLADSPSVNLLELAQEAGVLMIPILVLSVVVLAVGVERWLGLRRSKILPNRLVEALGKLAASKSQFDPRAAYHLCQKYPSTASTVVRAMLLKVGRPHSEVERAVDDASQREADRLYTHVRTLNLAAAISPFLGLLGTVWGMIQSFYFTANMPLGRDKSEVLASGIYTALMTTLAGLAVAIPAVILAHYFEGRIQRLLREIEELVLGLLPHIERYEGKLRVSRTQLSSGDDKSSTPKDEPTAVP